MKAPDQYQTTENVLQVAREAAAWISHLNMLSTLLEGRLRGYVDALRAFPESPQRDRMVRDMDRDLKNLDEVRKSGPIIV